MNNRASCVSSCAVPEWRLYSYRPSYYAPPPRRMPIQSLRRKCGDVTKGNGDVCTRAVSTTPWIRWVAYVRTPPSAPTGAAAPTPTTRTAHTAHALPVQRGARRLLTNRARKHARYALAHAVARTRRASRAARTTKVNSIAASDGVVRTRMPHCTRTRTEVLIDSAGVAYHHSTALITEASSTLRNHIPPIYAHYIRCKRGYSVKLLYCDADV